MILCRGDTAGFERDNLALFRVITSKNARLGMHRVFTLIFNFGCYTIAKLCYT